MFVAKTEKKSWEIGNLESLWETRSILFYRLTARLEGEREEKRRISEVVKGKGWG